MRIAAAVFLNNTARCAAASLVLAVAGFVPTAGATDVPAHVQTEIPNARLAGQFDFRWFGMKIYAAELWVGDAGYRVAAPTAAGFALSLRYARALGGAKIAETSRDEIRRLGFGTPSQHQSWLGQMTRLFPDVQQGTRITGVYLPDAGARFYLDGRRLGEVLDAEFGRAFFAIWLNPDTSAPAMREALLQNAGPRSR